MERSDAVAVFAAGLAVFIAAALILAQPGIAWLRSPVGTAQVAQVQHERVMSGGVTFLGADVPAREARPGETIPVTVYWQATGPIAHGYRSFVHLVGAADGMLWGQADKLNPADMPTQTWPLDRYVRDVYRVQIRPDAPPGEYVLLAGLWDCTDIPEGQCGVSNRLAVYGPDGEIEGDSVRLPITVTIRAD